jgi:hypothetical protein
MWATNISSASPTFENSNVAKPGPDFRAGCRFNPTLLEGESVMDVKFVGKDAPIVKVVSRLSKFTTSDGVKHVDQENIPTPSF